MSTTSKQSSYLRYLPPVLWEGDTPLLGKMLLVFEKILTGVSDDPTLLPHGDHEHEAIATVITQMYQLFDPLQTPAQFLGWLASWVDLTFPTAHDPQQGILQLWDEYQRRKAIGQMMSIYHQRGLKVGLNRYLDLYTQAGQRPRIAIDDGSRILFVQPQTGYFAQVATLVGQGPYSHDGSVVVDGLIAPGGIVLAPDGSLLICDPGTPTQWTPATATGLWRIQRTGQYDWSASGPQRLGPPAGAPPMQWNPTNLVALAVDQATPWNVYTLDVTSSGTLILYTLNSQTFSSVTVNHLAVGLAAPVAMVFYQDNLQHSHLLILDRSTPAGLGNPAQPRLIDVHIGASLVQATTLDLTQVQGTQVIEPLSLIVLANGDLIIGDGRHQDVAPAPAVNLPRSQLADLPGDLIYIQRNQDQSNPATWIGTSLITQPWLSVLSTPAADPTQPDPVLQAQLLSKNPLIAPVAVVRQDDSHFFVLDLGLKPFVPGLDTTNSIDGVPISGIPYLRDLAEPASVYLVEIEQFLSPGQPPVVTRITETGKLVHPTGMVLGLDGMLYIADAGEFSDPKLSGAILRVWRAAHHEFGVAIHFSLLRPTTALQRQRIIQNITDIVNQERPAHTDWALVYDISEPTS